MGSFTYEFTLLSNKQIGVLIYILVCFPYEFTLLSNIPQEQQPGIQFVSPTNHCSQTQAFAGNVMRGFVSPTNLHCSQTLQDLARNQAKFVSPTNLHCSQTHLTKI